VNALVTGAGGFLGLYIVEQLVVRGDRVRAFCRGSYPQLDALGVQTIRGDLRDRDATLSACRGMEVVFHVAGVAGLAGPWRHYHGVNTLGTHHVVEGCRAHGVSKLVYTSSPSVTFDGTDQVGVASWPTIHTARPWPRGTCWRPTGRPDWSPVSCART